MKKKKAKPARSARRFQRRTIMIVTAIAVVAIAAITVVSRQSANTKTVSTGTAKAPEYVNARVAAQDLQVPQNGRIRPLTQEEAAQLAQKLKGLLNKSTDGLEQVHHQDGSISMDLQGRFQNVTVARVNEDGTTEQSCVDNPKAAASFFKMDPQLLEDSKPVRPTPVN